MASKICNRCNIEKDIFSFSPAITCKDGFRNYCKSCQKITKDLWRHNNKKHHNLKSKLWVLANPEKRKVIALNYRTTNKDKIKVITKKVERQ